MMVLMINGQMVDTDDSTKIGLTYKSRLFARGGIELCRSFGLTLPATPFNDRFLHQSWSEDVEGLRTWAECEMMYAGVCLRGRIALQGYSGGRYEMLFVYGDFATDFELFSRPVREFMHFNESFEITGKDRPTTGRMVTDFGFYGYHNQMYNSNTYGQGVGAPPVLFPSCNLGWLIEQAAAAAGYTVYMPSADGRDPHQFGIVLPTMTTYSDTVLSVSGSGRAGWTLVSGAQSWADAGLTIEARRFKRGLGNANVTVYAFKAIRPVVIEYEKTSANAPWLFVSGVGYDVHNWTKTDGYYWPLPSRTTDCQFDLNTGDWFTIVNVSDVTLFDLFLSWHWDGQTGYTGGVACSFTVKDQDSDMPGAGSTITLQDNAPDMSLSQLLQAACDLTACVFEVNATDKQISIIPEESALNGADWFDLDNAKVTEIKSLERYIDGLARRNTVACKSADYVTETMRFKREYRCENDVLEEDAELATIPFNEGNWTETQGVKFAVFDDVQLGNAGATTYKGVLSVIFENAAATGDGSALHVQTVNDMGVGAELAAASRDAYTMRLTACVPFHLFAHLQYVSLAVWHGRRWHVRSAVWNDGMVDLELVMLNS